jgi:hypothetical protein
MRAENGRDSVQVEPEVSINKAGNGHSVGSRDAQKRGVEAYLEPVMSCGITHAMKLCVEALLGRIGSGGIKRDVFLVWGESHSNIPGSSSRFQWICAHRNTVATQYVGCPSGNLDKTRSCASYDGLRSSITGENVCVQFHTTSRGHCLFQRLTNDRLDQEETLLVQ